MRSRLAMPLLAVGAAFDYHAGSLRNPPAWMQRSGLEWLWRLALEPSRLWRRYLLLNPSYLVRLIAQRWHIRSAAPPAPASAPPDRFPV
jgi:UDP-N-acetyl-D-mannosaminuronic acid transferase (WecB/TagA/CpsF family)